MTLVYFMKLIQQLLKQMSVHVKNIEKQSYHLPSL